MALALESSVAVNQVACGLHDELAQLGGGEAEVAVQGGQFASQGGAEQFRIAGVDGTRYSGVLAEENPALVGPQQERALRAAARDHVHLPLSLIHISEPTRPY